MPHYRRDRMEGGSYFFGVKLEDRRSDLLVAEIAAPSGPRGRVILIHIDARVVLPDDMRCPWTGRPGDDDFSIRLRAIKALFPRSVTWAVPPAGPRRGAVVTCYGGLKPTLRVALAQFETERSATSAS